MTDKPDIGFLAASHYAVGRSPITVAEYSIASLLSVHTELLVRAARRGDRLPGWEDLSFEALARKVIGEMLDAGWAPPSDEDVQAAAAYARKQRQAHEAWWTALTEEQRSRAGEHFSKTGEWPQDLNHPATS